MKTARITRKRDDVTCRQCRRFMVMAEMRIGPIRGRPIEVRRADKSTDRGQLIASGEEGLELVRHTDGERVLVRWSQLAGFDYLDNESEVA